MVHLVELNMSISESVNGPYSIIKDIGYQDCIKQIQLCDVTRPYLKHKVRKILCKAIENDIPMKCKSKGHNYSCNMENDF